VDLRLEKFRNKLCIFEGADQTGKTTVAKLLTERLNNSGIPATFTFQPGDPAYGVTASFFRSLCKDKRWNLHPLSNMYAFFLDKVEQVTKIVAPALDKGFAVISDRWWHSTTAYQFFGKEIVKNYDMPQSVMDWLNSTSELGVEPDVVFYFPEKIKIIKGPRVSDQGESDMFETAGGTFMERVAEGYEYLARDPKLKFKRVQLGNSAEETLELLLDIDF